LTDFAVSLHYAIQIMFIKLFFQLEQIPQKNKKLKRGTVSG